MKQRMSSEFIYQLFALLIAIIVVHALYVGVIRPSARDHLEREAALQAAGRPDADSVIEAAGGEPFPTRLE